MKNVIVIAAAALALTACNQEQIAKLEWQRDSLMLINSQKDSSITLLAETMESVQSNLRAIKAKENIISIAANDPEQKASINDDVDAIYKLFLENKDKVAKLQKQLNAISAQNKEYGKLIDVLKQQIAQQNVEIERLKKILEEKDIEIGFLTDAMIKVTYSRDSISGVNARNVADLNAATDALNTAYYIVGTKSELLEKAVIESSGLFSKKISGNADRSDFTEIDVRNFDSLPLGDVKKVKILSAHPTGSFELEQTDDEQTIKIVDAKKFWSQSKYLVVQVR